MKTNYRAQAYIYLFITSIIWGAAGPVIKFTLDYFPPSIFLTYRFALSTIIALITFMLVPKNIPKNTKELPGILFYGFLTSTAALGLLFLGFDKTSALTGSILSALSPILITVLGVLFLREHATNREKLGIGVALIGTLLMIFEPILVGSSGSSLSSFEGNIYHLAALAITVATAVLAKMILRDSIDALTLTHIAFTIGFATMLPITLALHSPREILTIITQVPLVGHLGVIYMALFSGTIAYTLWHAGQKSIEIGETSLFSYLMPLFAAPLSVFWLHEPISMGFAVGAVVIAAGVYIAEYRKSLTTTKRKVITHRRKR